MVVVRGLGMSKISNKIDFIALVFFFMYCQILPLLFPFHWLPINPHFVHVTFLSMKANKACNIQVYKYKGYVIVKDWLLKMLLKRRAKSCNIAKMIAKKTRKIHKMSEECIRVEELSHLSDRSSDFGSSWAADHHLDFVFFVKQDGWTHRGHWPFPC